HDARRCAGLQGPRPPAACVHAAVRDLPGQGVPGRGRATRDGQLTATCSLALRCREPELLGQFRIAERLFVGRCFCWHPEFFAGPGAEVDALAACAAERPERVALGVDAVAAAARAADDALVFFLLAHTGPHAQSVSSKGVSCVLACRRSSASCRMSRTETMRRLPLISGTRPSLGSMRRRSSW